MLKIQKSDSPAELKLQALEDFLSENNIEIAAENRALIVTIDNRRFELFNIETEQEVDELPRKFDAEKLVVFE